MCMFVCVSVFVVELLLHFYPDRRQIWTPDRYGRPSGKINHVNERVDWGCKVPGDPRGQNVKQCSMTTNLGPKNPGWKLRMMMTFIKVNGQQRPSAVN